MKLDIGTEYKRKKGWVGMDYRDSPNVDIVWNWDDMPWPIEDGSCEKINASHVVEHVNPANGNFINWMNECWRILKPGGILRLGYPEAGTPPYWMDPTHCNGCNRYTWLYFDPYYQFNLQIANLYNIYRPLPWEICKMVEGSNYNEYVILRKRERDE